VAQLRMIANHTSANPARLPLYLGCPVWAYAGWRGTVFAPGTKSADFLARYSSVFNTVEGNSSFYALPGAGQIMNWKAAVNAHFRFCFKVPRRITHDLMLQQCHAEVAEFQHRIAPLAANLGPLLLQLGPNFAPAHLPILDRFLTEFGKQYPLCVEVRHPLFYFGSHQTPANVADYTATLAAESALDALLAEHQVHRCHFDTACVHRAAMLDETTLESQRRKPKLPRRTSIVGARAMFRVVGQNALADTDAEVAYYAPFLTQQLRTTPTELFVFLHTPDDLYAPAMAQKLYRAMRALSSELPESTLCAIDFDTRADAIAKTSQLSLF
jgi:uncharacterized protein YecE (DUF72 family)